MKYSTTALHLALWTGWTVEQNHCFHHHQHHYTHHRASSFIANTRLSQQQRRQRQQRGDAPAFLLQAAPHPPDQPPPSDVLNKQEAYFASPIAKEEDEQEDVVEDDGEEEINVAEEMAEEEATEEEEEEEDVLSLVVGEEVEPSSPPPPPPPPVIVPPKPFMTEEQKEELNAAAARFLEEVWSPLTEVQPGVPADTIKGAALAGATLAFLASKGLVVTSAAAGLSAAYVAISQGVAGDVLRTVGGIAWDVTNTATKLIQMATTNEKMRGMSKELASQVIAAVQESTIRAAALQELTISSTTEDASTSTSTPTNGESMDVEKATAAFLESQQDLERILREAESAIGAADAAIAQADQTLDLEELYDGVSIDPATGAAATDDTGADDDISVPYDATVQLAYQQASSSTRVMMPYDEFKTIYLQQAIEEVKAKQPIRIPYDARVQLAFESPDNESLRSIMSYADFKTMYLNNAVEEVKILRAKKAEEEAMRLAAEAEAKRKAEEAAAAAAAQALEEEEDDDGDADSDEDWLAAVEMAQQGIEGTIVGLDEAILDDGAKATWDAAGALAQELQKAAAEEDDDDEEDFEMDLEALGRAARAAVDKFEAEQAYDEDGDDDDDDEDLDDFLPEGDLTDLATAARQAVETSTFGTDDEDYEEEEEESFQGFDGMMVATSGASSLSAGSAARKQALFERDWSVLTVAKLKDELRFRGLKAYGNKSELISMLQAYDEKNNSGNDDDDDDDDDDFDEDDAEKDDDGLLGSGRGSSSMEDDDMYDLGDIDLEELGRQARAAVELGSMAMGGDFDAEEPSDEVLMQLESEESILLDPSSSLSEEDIDDVADYASMTVLQLKDELRERGLRVSGSKKELIERLENDDKES